MKKQLLVSLCFLGLLFTASAGNSDTTVVQALKDSSSWKKGGVASLNFNQSSFTNWAAGGQNSQAANALISVFATFKKGNTSWENTLDLAYGKTELGNDRPRKTDDRIDFSSKLGQYTGHGNWFYSGLFNFKSQFDDGYNYPNDSTVISRFMSPAFFVLSLGIDYKIKDYFSVFIGPVTGKVTVVNSPALANAGSFGVTPATYDAKGNLITPGKTHLEEFGGYLKVAFKKDIMKNVNLQTKVELFSNYLKNPQNVVVNWETLFALKVNKYLSASLQTQLMYDDKINIKAVNSDGTVKSDGPRVQFKEVLGIGLTCKF